MTQLFTPGMDSWFRFALLLGISTATLGVTSLLFIARSPYITDQDIVVEQDIPFSHQHHVSDIGIDCRYCHQGVENSARAGIPTTQVCMNCHRDLWVQSEMLAPVRDSYRTDLPIQWVKVHDLPDYVYFNHSIHVHKGIGCYSCHGRIGDMPLVRQNAPLTMQWCLKCHRNPEMNVRPDKYIYTPLPLEELVENKDTIADLRESIAAEKNIASKVNCYTCHR